MSTPAFQFTATLDEVHDAAVFEALTGCRPNRRQLTVFRTKGDTRVFDGVGRAAGKSTAVLATSLRQSVLHNEDVVVIVPTAQDARYKLNQILDMPSVRAKDKRVRFNSSEIRFDAGGSITFLSTGAVQRGAERGRRPHLRMVDWF